VTFLFGLLMDVTSFAALASAAIVTLVQVHANGWTRRNRSTDELPRQPQAVRRLEFVARVMWQPLANSKATSGRTKILLIVTTADAPIIATFSGSCLARVKAAKRRRKEGSLDARQRFRMMSFGASDCLSRKTTRRARMLSPTAPRRIMDTGNRDVNDP
jgi:hypothetical protein